MSNAVTTLKTMIGKLSFETLADFMERAVTAMYIEEEGGVEWVDPDKEWSPDTVDEIFEGLPEIIQRQVNSLREKPTQLEVHQPFTDLGFEHWHTGGGCTALQRNLADSQYMLVTDEDASSPDADTLKWCVGVYDDQAQHIEGEDGYRTFPCRADAVAHCKAMIEKYGVDPDEDACGACEGGGRITDQVHHAVGGLYGVRRPRRQPVDTKAPAADGRR